MRSPCRMARHQGLVTVAKFKMAPEAPWRATASFSRAYSVRSEAPSRSRPART